MRIIRALALLPLLFSDLARAQDASSWSSGSMTPGQRGETKLLRTDTPRKSQRPPTAVTAPADAATLQRLTPPGAVTGQGTGALASSTVPKSTAGNDAAYDAFDQGRYLTALDLAQKAAATGDAQAHTLIGRLYQDGLGVPVDLVVAAQWYRRAAELGDIEGTFAFAVMLAEGDGIQKNRAGAADLFETAAARHAPQRAARAPRPACPATPPAHRALANRANPACSARKYSR